MPNENSGGGLGKEGDLPSSPPPSLTQEQLDRMALEELWEINPNLADTAAQVAIHGFVWKHGPIGS